MKRRWMQRLLRDFAKYQNRDLSNALVKICCRSSMIVPVISRGAGLRPQQKVNELTKQQRRALLEHGEAVFRLTLRASAPVEEAIVTSGGVKVSRGRARRRWSRSWYGDCILRARCWMWTPIRAVLTYRLRGRPAASCRGLPLRRHRMEHGMKHHASRHRRTCAARAKSTMAKARGEGTGVFICRHGRNLPHGRLSYVADGHRTQRTRTASAG